MTYDLDELEAELARLQECEARARKEAREATALADRLHAEVFRYHRFIRAAKDARASRRRAA